MSRPPAVHAPPASDGAPPQGSGRGAGEVGEDQAAAGPGSGEAAGPLEPPAWAGTFTHRARGTSTMDLARAAPGAAHGHSWLLDRQTRGRGRRGRSWASEGHLGLWMTTVLCPRRLEDLSTLSLVAGCSLLAVLHRAGAHRAQLKWPNDIWVAGHKLAGILLEADGAPGPGGPRLQVWVGIGVNLATPPPQIGGVGLCDLLGPAPRAVPPTLALRDRLAAATAGQLGLDVAAWHRRGLAAFSPRLAAHDALVGAQVRVIPGGGAPSWCGRAAGIDGRGRLRVATAEGERRVVAGEVARLRPV